MIHYIAYVDPGTGSFALQALIGTVMGVGFAVRNHVKAFVQKFRKDSKTEKSIS